ncbi:peptidyl-prolyl cis-trans isomerase [candidate division WOR-3 bacterium]|nr:peptidyl-prolyl cis-trans isomerase [candidate division WOR-3 bacterium]
MKAILTALILFQTLKVSGAAPELFFSSSQDTSVSFSDVLAYRNLKDDDLGRFLLVKYFSLEAYENGIALEESLTLKTIAKEILYKHALVKHGVLDFTPTGEYLDSIRMMSGNSIRAIFICTSDSVLAEKVYSELSTSPKKGDSSFAQHAESLFFEHADPRISGIAEISWENVMYPLKEAVFSLEDYSAGEVTRFPTFYVVPVRLETKTKDPILPDTMNAEWIQFIASLAQTNYRIKNILDAIEIARPSYEQSTMLFFTTADSAKFDTIPFPMFPQISSVDSSRVVCRYLGEEMTAGEMLLRFRRKGTFPRLGDTVNLRFEIERRLIAEDVFTMPYEDEIKTDPFVRAEIKLMQNEHLYNVLKKRIEDTVFVDIYEMKEFYENNIEDYLYPEQIRYSIFMNPDSSLSDSMRRLIAEGFSFDSLSRLHSNHPTAIKGGDAGYRGRHQQGTIYPLVNELDKGEVSELFKAIDGWIFVQVTEVQPPKPAPFDSIQIRLKNDTRREKLDKTFAEFIAGLKTKHSVAFSINGLVCSFIDYLFGGSKKD